MRNNNWESHNKNFENFIKGLAKSEDLKKSLTTFFAKGFKLREEFIRDILDKFGFTNVDIIEYEFA